MLKLGSPLAKCASTVTSGALIPAELRVYTVARDMESFPCFFAAKSGGVIF